MCNNEGNWPTDNSLRAFKDLYEDIDLLIIDEISTTSGVLFLALDKMMKLAFDGDKPFGGKSILLLGDFCQLPPTGGDQRSIADHLVCFSMARKSAKPNMTPNELVSINSAHCLKHFQRVLLTKNERAKDDPDHCALLAKFGLENDKPPITMHDIRKWQQLDKELIEKDPKFEDAVIAVKSNQERIELSRLRTIRFAEIHKKPIYRWTLPMRVSSRLGRSACEMYDPVKRVYRHSAAFVAAGARELEFLFVEGMPLVMTEKMGHTSWHIANGRPGRAHSFTFHDDRLFQMPASSLTAEGAGKIFTIPQPDYINVELPPLASEPEGTPPIIVPVGTKISDQPFKMYLKHAPLKTQKRYGYREVDDNKGNKADRYTRSNSFLLHPVMNGMAITYEKLQGATVDRVILVLNDDNGTKLGKISIQKLYVGLSRVRHGKHLAIWPAKLDDLAYLTKLVSDERMRAWFRHYDENGFWKGGKIVLRHADKLFAAKFDANRGNKLADQSVRGGYTCDDLRNICRVYGIYFASKLKGELIECIEPFFDEWLKRKSRSGKRKRATEAKTPPQNKRPAKAATGKAKKAPHSKVPDPRRVGDKRKNSTNCSKPSVHTYTGEHQRRSQTPNTLPNRGKRRRRTELLSRPKAWPKFDARLCDDEWSTAERLLKSTAQQASSVYAFGGSAKVHRSNFGGRNQPRLVNNELLTLQPKTWLMGNVIDNYNFVLQEDNYARRLLDTKPACHWLSSDVNLIVQGMTTIRSGPHIDALRADARDLDYIFLPANYNLSHWNLIAIDVVHKQINVYDSGHRFGCINLSKRRARQLGRWIHDIFRGRLRRLRGIEKWQICVPRVNVPQQTGGTECGIYCATFSRCLSENISFDFNQSHMPHLRYRMLLSIYNSEIKDSTIPPAPECAVSVPALDKYNSEMKDSTMPPAPEGGAASVPALDKKDQETWKFALHDPTAKTFKANSVVGRFFITKVDRNLENSTIWLKQFLGNPLLVADLKEDNGEEFFEVEGQIGKIRPSTAPDCDDDVVTARALHDETVLAKVEAERKQRRREGEARQARKVEKRAAAQRAAEAWKGNEQTLHVGDTIQFQNPFIDREYTTAQVVSMCDPSGRVPWDKKVKWTFDGLHASQLTPSTNVCIIRRWGLSETLHPEWRFALGSYKLPEEFEQPLEETDMQENARQFFAQGNANIDKAFRDYVQ